MANDHRHFFVSVPLNGKPGLARLSDYGIVRKITVLLALCVMIIGICPPAAADDCIQPVVTLSPANSNGEIGSVLSFTASTQNPCPNCDYSFRIVKTWDELGNWAYNQNIPLGNNDISPVDRNIMAHGFTDVGMYEVHVTVTNPSTCTPASQGEAVAGLVIARPQTPIGFNGACSDPLSVGADVIQSSQTSEIGSSTPPSWTAYTSAACYDCYYTWSVWKITPDTWVPYPSAGNNEWLMAGTGGRAPFTFRFTEPGDYKINVKVANPTQCPNSGWYTSMTAIHHVTAPAVGGQPSDPLVISPVALEVPATGTPGTTPAPTSAVTQPQVTYTAIPGTTQPVATIPQGTLRPTGQATAQISVTPAPASSYGTDKQASVAAPVVTTAAPGGSVPAAPTTAAPMTATTRAPGFAFAGALCAGLVVLVLRRK